MKFAPFLVILSSLISVSLGDEGTEELKAFFESKLDELTNTVNEMKIRAQVRTNLTIYLRSPYSVLLSKRSGLCLS